MSDINVGSVYVDIEPSAKGWINKLRSQILPDVDRLGLEIGRTLSKRINESLSDARVTVDVNSAVADLKLASTEALVDSLDGRSVDLKLNVDDSVGKNLSKNINGGLGGAAADLSQIEVIAIGIAAALPALLALPSLLAAVAVPLGVLALGFNGIKRAASGLAGPLKVLQSVISSVFEDQLTPVFDQLLKVFPTLIVGFQLIAHDLSVVFSDVVASLTSGSGLAALQATISNIGQAIIVLAPAMGSLTTTLLTLLSSGSAAFAQFAPFLADTITKFSQLVALLSSSGALAAAFRTLNFLVGAVVVAIGAAVIGTTLFYAGIERLDALIGVVVGSIIVAAVRTGQAAGSIASGVVGAFNRVKSAGGSAVHYLEGLPGKFVDALSNLPGLLYKSGQYAIQGLINGITSRVKSLLSTLAGLGSKIAGAIHVPGIHVPGYASGTNSAPGGLAIVGEAGPELVALPRGSQVIPNSRLSTRQLATADPSGSGAMRVVSGSFTIDKKGRAWFEGIAQDQIDAYQALRNTTNRMRLQGA